MVAGSRITSLNPVVALTESLHRTDPVPLLEYRTNGRAASEMYLRIGALDDFNGVEWRFSQQRLQPVPDPLPKVDGLSSSVAGSTVDLSWAASTDAVLVAGYEVHRSASAGFTPSAGTRVAAVNGTTFQETGVPAGTWFYKVVARDGSGNRSAASSAHQVVVS